MDAAVVKRLESYLKSVLGWQVSSESSLPNVVVSKFSHGQSNPTYLVETCKGFRCVLRKKPHGNILPSAHAIEREYTILKALSTAPFPVPQPLHFCEDETIIGTSFYLMEYKDGRIFVNPQLPELSPAGRNEVYNSMAQTLAALHSIDPEILGLGDFGAKENYATRQISRWKKQYLKSLMQDNRPMPEVMHVAALLEANVPDKGNRQGLARISHGDFRLDNLIYHKYIDKCIIGVIDWELATLGDPLADLAYCSLIWRLPNDLVSGFPVIGHPLPKGIPSEEDFMLMYCRYRGIPMPNESEWKFFLGLSIFRLTSILAGVSARAKHGNASSAEASMVGSDLTISGLAKLAIQIMHEERPESVCSSFTPHKNSYFGMGVAFQSSTKSKELLDKLHTFMEEHVTPAECTLNSHAFSKKKWTIHPLQEELKQKAKAAGLWNLWISPDLASSMRSSVLSLVKDPEEQKLLLGPGLSNLEYAFLAEEMGRSVWASEACNCSAPDTGNMEVLGRFGTISQQKQWLVPLLKGDIRSCFAMTEPAVASSDARNIQGSISRNDSDGCYVINARKWWISGAMDPRCQIAIVMGKTNPTAPPHKQQSMILVPMNTPGVEVVRPIPVMGFDDAPHGHAEIIFRNVTVPGDSIVWSEGNGFAIAQERLGPGRLHHCMRLLGLGERATQIMIRRSKSRRTFGKDLWMHQDVRLKVAKSRVELDAARLVVLDAAASLDRVGNKASRGKVSEAKFIVPRTVLRIIDRSIQIHGGAGVGDTTPLAAMWASARTLRLADGPDVVHLETIAKLELKKFEESEFYIPLVSKL